MLSKLSMKSEKGISRVAIIVAIAVAVVVLLTLIIVLLVASANSSKSENTVNTNTIAQEVWDTNNNITLEEKNDLKQNYLSIFSLLISDKYQTENENLIEVARQFINMGGTGTSSSSTTTDTTSSTTNTVDTNTVASTSTLQQTMENDTIVITGDNPLNPTNTANTVDTTNTVELNTSSLPNMNINASNPADRNALGLDEEDVAKAIDEVYGKTIDNLSTLLNQWSSTSEATPGFVTDIVSISKANGVYNITYKVCWPTPADITKYGTIDKVRTSALDKLESTTVNIKLVKNRTYDYSQYKVQSIMEVEKETPVCYYLSYVNEKFGVIDQTGKIIIPNTYDWIDIPNNYKDIFVCITGQNSVVLDKDGQQRYEDYENISVIRSTAGGESMWYEKDFLVFKENGKYGAIDYDGFVVYEPIYDAIEPLFYFEGKIVLTESGQKALGDITGKAKNFKYTSIGLLGAQFDMNTMVNSQRTIEQVQAMMQEGYIIVGQDMNEIVERIEIVTPAQYQVDTSATPAVTYPADINTWSLRLLDNVYSVYISTQPITQPTQTTTTNTVDTTNTLNTVQTTL